MERFLLHFREQDYQTALYRVYDATSRTRKAVEAINEICSVKVDEKLFKDLLFYRGDATAEAIKKAVTEDLNKAGISSTTVRDAAVKGDLEKYYTILNDFQRPDSDIVKSLSIDEEGIVQNNAEDLEKLKEQYCSYIETEKGLEAYHAHLKLIESINSFLKLCPWISPRTLPQMYGAEFGSSQVTLPVDIAYDRITQIPQ